MAETRKQDGSEYPPKILYQLLAGLLRDMRSRKPNCCNFLDPDDHRFEELHNGIDNLFRELRSSEVGSDTKSAEVITKDEEVQLWEKDCFFFSFFFSIKLYANAKDIVNSEKH